MDPTIADNIATYATGTSAAVIVLIAIGLRLWKSHEKQDDATRKDLEEERAIGRTRDAVNLRMVEAVEKMVERNAERDRQDADRDRQELSKLKGESKP